MSKKDLKVKIGLNEDDEVKISISEELQQRIPRVGDKMFLIQPYPVDDDDEDERGKVKENAIMGYSYAKRQVRATSLPDEGDSVLINGEFKVPLNENMTIQTSKLMLFTKEEDAKEKYRSLMNASIEEAKERRDKYNKTVDYLEEALEKEHH